MQSHDAKFIGSRLLSAATVDFLFAVVASQEHSTVSLLIVCSTNRAIPPARSALEATASPPPHRKIVCRLTKIDFHNPGRTEHYWPLYW